MKIVKVFAPNVPAAEVARQINAIGPAGTVLVSCRFRIDSGGTFHYEEVRR